MKDSLTAMQHIQAPEDPEIRKRARSSAADEYPPICPRCQDTGVVVTGVNGATEGKIGCRECGRGEELLDRVRTRAVMGARVLTRRARR